MRRLSPKLEQLMAGASDISWKTLATELRNLGLKVERAKGSTTHWAVWYPDRPDMPIQTVAIDQERLRKPVYASRLRRLVRIALEESEEDNSV